MAKLLIEVECGTEACGDCRWFGAFEELFFCKLFHKELGPWVDDDDFRPPRCPVCIAAERAAKKARR